MRYIIAIMMVSFIMLSCGGYTSTDGATDSADTTSRRESPYNTPGATDYSQPNE